MANRSRFVRPGTKRLNLSDGDWIDIKARLNIEEAKMLESAPLTSVKQTSGGTPEQARKSAEVGLDWGGYWMAKLTVYLVDWSFIDGEEQAVPCTPSAIAALDPDSANECMAAIDAYLNEVALERAGKGAKTGKPSLAVSS